MDNKHVLYVRLRTNFVRICTPFTIYKKMHLIDI